MKRGREFPGKKVTQRRGFEQLEGRNVVLEAFRAGRELTEILLDRGARPKGVLARVLELAEERSVQVSVVPRQVLDRLSLTHTHNGIMAWAVPRPEPTLEELLSSIEESPFLVLLDQVQYEQNLGAIMRTAEAAGVHGLLVPKSHSAPVTPMVRRISAGASEHIPLVRVSTMVALKELRKADVRIVGADEHSEVTYDQVDLTGPVALIMGGEHKGLSEPVRRRCDHLVSIPMKGRIPSLNVSVAAALLIYEKVRQERAAAAAPIETLAPEP